MCDLLPVSESLYHQHEIIDACTGCYAALDAQRRGNPHRCHARVRCLRARVCYFNAPHVETHARCSSVLRVRALRIGGARARVKRHWCAGLVHRVPMRRGHVALCVAGACVAAWLLVLLAWRLMWHVQVCSWTRATVLSTEGDIPPIVHRTAHLDVLPQAIEDLYAKTERDNPGWTVRYTSFAQGRLVLVASMAPEVVDAFDRLMPAAFKADLLRLCLVYLYGGVYSDFSQSFLVPLDDLVDRRRDNLVLSLDHPRTVLALFHVPRIANAFFAAKPRHPFLKACIDRIVRNVHTQFYGTSVMDPTGPGLLAAAVKEHAPDYRMSIGLTTEVLSALRNGQVFSTLAPPHTPVIQHKHKDHYALLGGAAPLTGKGTHYVDMWMARSIYAPARRLADTHAAAGAGA